MQLARELASTATRLRRVLSVGAACLLVASNPRAAFDSSCRDETPDASAADPYAAKDGRCEGIYVRKFAASIVPQSFTLGTIPAPAKANAVTVKWDPSVASPTADLVVRNLRCSPQYQMHATVDATKGKFGWPTTVLAKYPIQALGVQLIKGDGRYVPAAADPPSSQSFQFAFCTSDSLVNVWIKVYDPDDNLAWQRKLDKAKGSIVFEVPAASFKPHSAYRMTVTCGAISSGLAFVIP